MKYLFSFAVVLGLFFSAYSTVYGYGPTPVVIEWGTGVDIHWDVIGVTSCNGSFAGTAYPVTGDGIASFWTGTSHPGFGSQSFTSVTAPPNSYTFVCSSGAISDSVTLQIVCPPAASFWNGSACVVPAPSTPTINWFINDGPVPYNTSANVTASVTGATECSINNGVGTVAPTGGGPFPTGNLTVSTTFTLSCRNGSSPWVTAQTNVTVGPPPPATHPVTVTPPTGGGSIIGPGGINCPGVCNASLPAGSTPTITVVPPPGGSVQSITVNGTNVGPGPSYTLPPLTGPVTVGAVCNPPPGTFPVTVTPPLGGGSITGPGINCPGDCSESFPANTTPTITVVPPPGGSVQSITVNGTNVGPGPSYTLPPITGPVSIGAQCIPPAMPDLISQSLTVPGSGTDGVAMPISAEVQNVGGAGSGAFTNNFTYQWNGSGAWTQFATVPHGGLGAGASVTDGPVSYTPTQSGTLRIQHCVDAVPGAGVISESSESNCRVSGAIAVGSASLSCPASGGTPNCSYPSAGNGGDTGSGSCTGGRLGTCTVWCNPSVGAWEDSTTNCDATVLPITLEVCDASGNNCTSTPGPLSIGSTPSIRWTSNGDRCEAQMGNGFSTLPSGFAGSGFDPVTPPAPGGSDTYRVMCTNGGNIATADTQDLVVSTQFNNPILTIKQGGVSVNTVKLGTSVTVEWNSNNGDETKCSLTGGGLSYPFPPGLPSGGDPESGTTPSVTIQGRTTFRIDCNGLVGTKTVEVVPIGWES